MISRLHISRIALCTMVLSSSAFPSAASAGTLLISYNGEAQAALVDAKTHKPLATLSIGPGPHEVRLSSDQRFAYFAMTGTGPGGTPGNEIAVVDLRDRKLKARFDLGTYTSPHDVRVSRDGRRIWVACAPAQSILEVDADSGKIVKTYSTGQAGSYFVEVTPDERTFYTPNLEGKSVSIIDRESGNHTVIPFDKEVYGIDITPDGQEVWVTGPGIVVIDAIRKTVKARLQTPQPDVGRVRLTQDGRTAVVDSDSSNDVWVYDVGKKELVGTIATGSEHKVLALSSDGNRAFLTNPDSNSVTVVDIRAMKQVGEFKVGKQPDGIAWAD